MKQYIPFISFLIISLLFLSSCTSTLSESMITLEVTRPIATFSTTPASFKIETEIATLSPTATFTPSSTTAPTPTFLPRSTPTITPTLTLSEKETLLYDLFENNGGCLLPCWWGFTPGQTIWAEAQPRLAILALYIAPLFPLADPPREDKLVHLSDPRQIYRLEQFYKVTNGIITSIESNVHPVPSYSLATILTIYGQPAEVWLRSQSYVTPETGTLYFEINLWYPVHGFMLGYYQSWSTLSEGGIITSCLDDKIFINISIWDPSVVSSLYYMDMSPQTLMFRPTGYELSLEEATGMTVETFYSNYQDANVTPCFTTPSDIWPGL